MLCVKSVIRVAGGLENTQKLNRHALRIPKDPPIEGFEPV